MSTARPMYVYNTYIILTELSRSYVQVAINKNSFKVLIYFAARRFTPDIILILIMCTFSLQLITRYMMQVFLKIIIRYLYGEHCSIYK